MSNLKNPMRFSLRHDTIDINRFDVDFTELEMRPSEGSVYLYWENDD